MWKRDLHIVAPCLMTAEISNFITCIVCIRSFRIGSVTVNFATDMNSK